MLILTLFFSHPRALVTSVARLRVDLVGGRSAMGTRQESDDGCASYCQAEGGFNSRSVASPTSRRCSAKGPFAFAFAALGPPVPSRLLEPGSKARPFKSTPGHFITDEIISYECIGIFAPGLISCLGAPGSPSSL